jgi:hypothetical protein
VEIQALWTVGGRHVSLCGHLAGLLYMLLDIVFVFGLEFYGRVGNDPAIVLLEPVAPVFNLE